MKNIKYLGLLLVAIFISCSDLEEVPVGRLSPDGLVNSPQDIQTLINGAIGINIVFVQVLWSSIIMQIRFTLIRQLLFGQGLLYYKNAKQCHQG